MLWARRSGLHSGAVPRGIRMASGSHGSEHETAGLTLPEAPVDRLVAPIVRFMHVEAASGVVLLVFTLAALVLANSQGGEAFLGIWKTSVRVGFGPLEMNHSLKHWINDGLMAIFFFVIGLEVKRELVLGELRDARRAALPVAAAIGGMVVPAGIYLALQLGERGESGWGIPMATDIAFVVGCMALFGSRVPQSLRVLLLSLAIADDIGAILVIALGYTSGLDLVALVLGFAGIGVIASLERLGVRSIGVYVFVGALIWLAFHASGVHATIAGVMLGLLTPARAWLSEGALGQTVRRASEFLHGGEDGEQRPPAPRALLSHMETSAREAVSPLTRLETALHPWVSFGIMPLFAFANAGVVFKASYVDDPIAIAVLLGLLVGKPLGIVSVSWIAIRLGLAQKPPEIGWDLLAAGGCLAGIGFTMALFIADLALDESPLYAAKVGILAASGLAGCLGLALLAWRLPSRRGAAPTRAH